VTGPFQGHIFSVSSVAYSPDGTHIVSGSVDRTIRVWNATTGQSVAGSFHGHTDFLSALLPIHLMGPTLSLTQRTAPLGFGMQPLVSLWQVHSRGTHLGSPLLSIHLMGLALSLAHGTTPLGFGMQLLVSLWQVHSKGTQIMSALLPIHLMGPILSLAQGTRPLGCGGLKSLFVLVIYMRKIAGFNLLMALTLAGWPLGIGTPRIFLAIL
jgi:hypothetical protein